jgi:uncharacterized protein YndB with AHSA1/START domain
MSITFIFIIPVVIGFLTVFLMPREKVKSYSAAFGMPWLTTLAILIITILVKIEGTICWIMIFPIFAVAAGLGGIIAFSILKRNDISNERQNNQDEILDSTNKFQVSLIVLLPLFLGFIEGNRAQKKLDFNITQEITIAAPASKVWKAILNISPIENHETGHSFSTLLGFPNHLETTLDTLAIGGKRLAKYEKGLFFEEIITQYEPEKRLVLDVNTDPNKIPLTVMDEHIVIGGKHLDILEDIYTLDALPGGKTKLTLSSRFFINTPFNWYSSIWANYLMNDILKNELNIIQKRVKID